MVTWRRHVTSAVSRPLVRGDTWLEQVVCDQTVRLYIVTGVRDTQVTRGATLTCPGTLTRVLQAQAAQR